MQFLKLSVLILPAVICHSAIANDPIYLPAEVVAPAPQAASFGNMPVVTAPAEQVPPSPLYAYPTAAESEFAPIPKAPSIHTPVISRQVTPPPAATTTIPQGAVVTEAPQSGYVRLGAPLYPSPSPHVPVWTGGSMITNQAFAPHEMLYAHKYKALYPPYYHKVKGHWLLTPFGVKSHERWELQGTMVEVNYHSHYPLLPKFTKPHTSQNHGPWR